MVASAGTGKTRLSTEFKNLGKKGNQRDTLYFNAFTEDLFQWDNDLANDRERVLKINKDSRFFAGLGLVDVDVLHPLVRLGSVQHQPHDREEEAPDEDVLLAARDLDVLHGLQLVAALHLAREAYFPLGRVDAEVEVGVSVQQRADAVVHLQLANPAKVPKFDAVVANPPFSYRWEPTEALGDDVRFKNYGLAPKSAADFAFLLHGFHSLNDQGVMAIILPHGVLFRGGAEERIRTKLLKDGHIDTVIGLPANLFYSTGIPVCILVLKRCKKPDDVLFINASGPENFSKGKRQNYMTDEQIDRIIRTYRERPEKPIERYARRVAMKEIEANDYNLNISRYVSTAQEEREIDLAATHVELVKIENDIRRATTEHNEFLKELGLPLLPSHPYST